ncbi:hypothetical protein TrLO_g5150 [Triparma laevis f. longispina]|uniref:Protein archease-like n=1 Tax=Triparma laevis f. longispina TaxID=1714387 RepID=A0A9W7FEZ0_9STRA|nr:hypothetical protein TrLO_g5150 [Triparma laevis f. longispina]
MPAPQNRYRLSRLTRSRPSYTSTPRTLPSNSSSIAIAVEERGGRGGVNKDSLKDMEAKSAAHGKVHGNYEYLPHTADIQLHSWGPTLNDTLSSLCIAMFGYMTDLTYINLSSEQQITFKADNLNNLIFKILDEWLVHFHTTGFICKEMVTQVKEEGGGWEVECVGKGENFDIEKHTQGTEVKAITYSNLQIHQKTDKVDIYVIIDI